jgi:hypothetical protein
MAFSNWFRLPLFPGASEDGDRAQRTVIHNPDGSLANFPAAEPIGVTHNLVNVLKSTSTDSVFTLMNASETVQFRASTELVRAENSTTSDLYLQIVRAADEATATAIVGINASGGIMDVIQVPALGSRSLTKEDFARLQLTSLSAGQYLMVRVSTTLEAFTQFIPTGTEVLSITSRIKTYIP